MDGHWRTISVALQANTSGYMAGMARATTATKGFSRDVKASERDLAGFSARAGDFGRKMTVGVTLPLAAAGAAAYKLSTDFARTFQQAQGLAGVAASEVAGLRQEVFDLAAQTGQSPQLLAEGLYEIRSSGLSGQAALDTLTASAQAAAAGLGEARTVADATTSAINAYGQENLDAARATDILIAAVREGKGEPREMAGQFGRLLPIASELGVEFEEVGGGLAFLTRSSGDAAQSSTQLLGVMSKILRPTQQARDVLASVGLSAEEVQRSVEEDGLLAALQMLEERFGGNRQAMTLMFDDVEALNGVLALLRNGGQEAAEVMQAVGDSGGSLREAFEGWEATEAADAQKALADLQATAIEVGSELAPIVADIASGVGDIASAFRALPDPAQKTLLILAGVLAIAGPAASAMSGLAKATALVSASSGKAAGALSSVVGAARAHPAAAAAVAAGAVVIIGAWQSLQSKGKETEAAIDAVVGSAERGAGTIDEAFRESLALGLSGQDDAFGDFSKLGDALDSMGVSAEEFLEVIRGSEADVERFTSSLLWDADTGGDPAALIEDVYQLAEAYKAAEAEGEQLATNQESLGVGADDTASSVDGLAGSTDDLAGIQGDALEAAKAYEEALEAEAEAADTARDAFLDMADVVGGLSDLDPEELTGAQIGQFYRDQAAAALVFADDIRKAFELGYDPQLVADLLQQGPEQAGPILRTMVEDHSANLVEQVNASTDTLQSLSNTAAEMARLTHRATTATSDEMIRDLSAAMRIAESNMRTGGQRSAAAIAEELGIGVGEVRRIAEAYGITLADSVNPILSATGQPQIQRPTRDPDAYSGYWAGGYVDGPEVNRDVVPAMLMPGEVVIRKAMAKRWGTDALLALNAGQVPTGWNIPGYAGGGRVTGDTVGLHPAHMAGLQAWSAVRGVPYHIRSGYRSIAEQERLYQAYLNGTGNLAAVPGSSMHNYGLATDGPHWGAYARGSGFHFPVRGEPWHAELLQARALRGQGVSTHGIIPPILPEPPSIGDWPLARGGEGAMGKAYEGAKAWLASLNMGASVPSIAAGAGGNRGIGQAMAAARGWTGSEWSALEQLWTRESGWNHTADNPTSSAYGIPQALPGSKMASAGADWRTNPATQIAWGLGYIADRYGSPSRAFAAWSARSPHWYGRGGEVTTHGRTFDSGGTLAPGWNMVRNATGKPEPLRPVEAPHRGEVHHHHIYVGNEYLGDFVEGRADARIEASAETDDRLARMGSRNA